MCEETSMRTLLIDDCGSFTHNLSEYLAACNGQPPCVVRNDELSWPEIAALDFDNIVISLGPGNPRRASHIGVSADALRHASVPVLGICLGHQAIAEHCGATVARAAQPMHGRIDRIRHDGSDLFHRIPQEFAAARYDSLVVTNLPDELEALAWASDGNVMALRHTVRPWWGVQFHPASVCTEYGARLLCNFRDLSERWRADKRRGSGGAAAGRPAQRTSDARKAPRAAVQAVCVEGCPDTEAVFCQAFGDSESCFWLDSSTADARGARFSYMGAAAGPDAEVVTYRSRTGQLDVRKAGHNESRRQTIFDFLKTRTDRAPPAGPPLPFDFAGGYVGYFGYELKGELGGDHGHEASTPDALWMRADRFLAFDHAEQQTWIVSVHSGEDSPEDQAWSDAMRRILAQPAPPPPTVPAEDADDPIWQTSLSNFRESLLRCQQEILDGEIYSVCLTNQLTGTTHVTGLDAYRALRQRHPAPYAAFLRSGALSVLCASPELFLHITPGGVVESGPLKEMARRGNTPAQDTAMAAALTADKTSRAENLMLVDVVRNDLNRVCKVGSVHVPRMFHLETSATAHRLVSTVRGELRPEVTAVDCVRAAFPAGSMTGVPKLQAMKFLDQIEQAPRGVHSGSIGFLSVNGSAKLNVAVNTMVCDKETASIGSGSTITFSSDPDAQVAETVLTAGVQRGALWPLTTMGTPADSQAAPL
jgi:para-aminobenzoate synthetase